ncbi:MAG: hypothetical protein LEGION0403_FIIPPAGN_02161 [Legionella sp.]|uniref:hypothetical protein n=1 Tax=Legionella sp. TaxID=459 RepID=UPI003D0E5B74
MRHTPRGSLDIAFDYNYDEDALNLIRYLSMLASLSFAKCVGGGGKNLIKNRSGRLVLPQSLVLMLYLVVLSVVENHVHQLSWNDEIRSFLWFIVRHIAF